MRALIPSTCLLLLTALGGCVGTSDPPLPIPENPNRLTYHSVDYPYAVHFAAASDALSAGEMTRLQSFLKSSSAPRNAPSKDIPETTPPSHKYS